MVAWRILEALGLSERDCVLFTPGKAGTWQSSGTHSLDLGRKLMRYVPEFRRTVLTLADWYLYGDKK